ncbi:MAG: carboxypeptidase-like regulatory domain-containing protein [Ignavibacteriota bacterium]
MVRAAFSFFLAACLSVATTSVVSAQSITSGAITGTVTDPSGAATPKGAVTITNVNTNASQSTITSQQGSYRFAFVPPGTYDVTVAAAGFQSQKLSGIVVSAGQPTAVNAALQVAAEVTMVEVSTGSDIIQTSNADVNTTFNTQMIQNLPNPGGDLTYFAQTAPGVVMNTQAGYGNFVADGMPATSNLFTINGTNNNDPFFGINNSGGVQPIIGVQRYRRGEHHQ